ncbi:MAG: hypothetical protein V4850_01300 [Myxococcota bacterium]
MGDFGLSSIPDEPEDDGVISLGDCEVTVAPTDPLDEQCVGAIRCSPAVELLTCTSGLGAVDFPTGISPGVAGIGTPARTVGASNAPCSLWTATRPPPQLADFFSTRADLLKAQWMFMGISDAACEEGRAGTFASLFSEATYGTRYIANVVVPYAAYEKVGGGFSASRSDGVTESALFRYWVGIMHFPVVFGEVDEDGTIGVPSDFRGHARRVGAFMDMVGSVKAYVIRKSIPEFGDECSGPFVRVERVFPCHSDPEYADSLEVDDTRPPDIDDSSLGAYADFAAQRFYTASFTRAAHSSAWSLLGRVVVGETWVEGSPSATETDLARRGFDCLFGKQVEVGVEVSYLPFGSSELATGVSRGCLTADSLQTVESLRDQIDGRLSLTGGGLVYDHYDVEQIEDDLAAS